MGIICMKCQNLSSGENRKVFLYVVWWKFYDKKATEKSLIDKKATEKSDYRTWANYHTVHLGFSKLLKNL